MNYVYTAIFNPDTTNKNLLNITFPDLPKCYTCGDSLIDAIEMAEDILCLHLYDMEESGTPIPPATPPHNIKTQGSDFISSIVIDTDDYRMFYANQPLAN